MLDLSANGIPLSQAPKAVAGMSPEVQRDVLERTREGNKWLEEQFGLDLKRMGYFEL